MNKNSLKIGTRVLVRVRDKLGAFNPSSPVAAGEVVFISPYADYVIVDMGRYRSAYWCEDISPAED